MRMRQRRENEKLDKEQQPSNNNNNTDKLPENKPAAPHVIKRQRREQEKMREQLEKEEKQVTITTGSGHTAADAQAALRKLQERDEAEAKNKNKNKNKRGEKATRRETREEREQREAEKNRLELAPGEDPALRHVLRTNTSSNSQTSLEGIREEDVANDPALQEMAPPSQRPSRRQSATDSQAGDHNYNDDAPDQYRTRKSRRSSSISQGSRPGAIAVRGFDFDSSDEDNENDFPDDPTVVGTADALRVPMRSVRIGDTEMPMGSVERHDSSPDFEPFEMEEGQPEGEGGKDESREEEEEEEEESKPFYVRCRYLFAGIGVIVVVALGVVLGAGLTSPGGPSPVPPPPPIVLTPKPRPDPDATSAPSPSPTHIPWIVRKDDGRLNLRSDEMGFGRNVELGIATPDFDSELMLGTSGQNTITTRQYNTYWENWANLGESIEGNAFSMGSDGGALAVMKDDYTVNVFRRNRVRWENLGAAIPNLDGFTPLAMTLAGDGLVVAIGGNIVEVDKNSTQVRVLEYNPASVSWVELGIVLDEPHHSQTLSIALSGDGHVLSAGRYREGDGAIEYNFLFQEGKWKRAFSNNNGLVMGGLMVSMPDDGSVMAIGSAGQVKLLDLQGGQRGQTITLEDDSSLNATTTTLVSMAPTGTAFCAGYGNRVDLWVFDPTLEKWEPRGDTLTFTDTVSSVSVVVAPDGKISVAVGVEAIGTVFVYDLDE
eukprot:CAMPEP_0116867778 /NCGR_PEP_ID=MMETSP0418-20121206/26816_1 /TAXON_ID=1158023 /ORGANISM="Astrosyne radiata, Strain 13vi08-1A" /LENGTH=714 /DNA_ID=CAMNT_0004503647 /DNA_START=1 /DNA_END=2145 /DNA_ORIENTATION=-